MAPLAVHPQLPSPPLHLEQEVVLAQARHEHVPRQYAGVRGLRRVDQRALANAVAVDAAKALGRTVSETFLVRADQVIE
jgi:hypothetical protein